MTASLLVEQQRDNTARRADDKSIETLASLGRVSSQNGLALVTTRLAELRQWLEDDLSSLEHSLQTQLFATTATQGVTHKKAALHLLSSPGKRLRPLCVILAARLGGRGLDNAVRAAAMASELIHAATLLHDDVIDEGEERRGVAAARMVYGNAISILGGDQLLVEALRLLSTTQTPSLMTSALDVLTEMVSAEAIQLERRGRFEPSREVYLRVIEGKTAALFRWALVSGATLGGLSLSQREALQRAGIALGRAFQLVDDVLDIEGDPSITGKDPLADIKQGKLTWPLLVACEQDAALAQRIQKVVQEGAPREVLCEIIDAIKRSGAVEATKAFAKAEGMRACAELESLPLTRASQALVTVFEAATSRLA
jgi:octaprenyl-diphosphate synthase